MTIYVHDNLDGPFIRDIQMDSTGLFIDAVLARRLIKSFSRSFHPFKAEWFQQDCGARLFDPLLVRSGHMVGFFIGSVFAQFAGCTEICEKLDYLGC